MLVTISKGMQITIPANMRKALDLHAGSNVEIEQKKGKIVIKPIDGPTLEEAFEMAKHVKPKYPNMTAEEMDELNEKMFR
jgi:AbrB family looped-hinge helix DNA binding protein